MKTNQRACLLFSPYRTAAGLTATHVGGESMEGSDELRQHAAIFSIQPAPPPPEVGVSGGDVDAASPLAPPPDDASSHLLLRARR